MGPSVVVTGASRGIGRATALEFARRGYDTIATMRNTADGASLIAEADEARVSGKLRVERLDVNDPSSIDLPSDLGILVNNAGVETENESIEHGDIDAHWRYLFEANVFGLVRVTQRAIPLLRDQGGGVICNITSSSILAPVPFLGMYRASKAAVMALGESLAAEVAQFGIRVVEVMPGPIVTDMLAASERKAAGAEAPEYAALGESMWAMRQQTIAQYTPAEEAARRIVNACTADDDAPLRRVGCDDLSEGMLAAWKSMPSHELTMAILASFSTPS